MPSNISLLLQCNDSASHVSQVTAFLAKKYNLSEHDLLKNPDLHWLNPDTVPEEFGAMSIEQVRDMGGEMVMRPYEGMGEAKQAIFVICKIELASVPAQNALLKSLEEPPAHVQFILTTSNIQRVLPTILSRCSAIELDKGASKTATAHLDTFSSASYTDLMEMAGKYKEKTEANDFLKELLVELHSVNMRTPSGKNVKLLQQTLVSIDYLNKNVNTRLVLENLLFQFKAV